MEQNSLLDSLKKATENKLSNDYVLELLKCCFTSQKIFELCKAHLKYHYLQSEPQKKIVQYLFDTFDATNAIPTIGIIGQAHLENKEVIALLSQIKKIQIVPEQHDTIINEFENFIKLSRFKAMYAKMGELFNQEKHDEAIQFAKDESEEINNFKLKASYYDTVFKDFDKRNAERQANSENKQSKYCIWGIEELDDITRGIEYGRSALIMARSGGGKSTMMKWVGLSNARLGKRVVHFQAEGTKNECLAGYDAAWTSINLDDMEMGNIPQTKLVKIQKAHRDIVNTGGEIYVYASEQFDSLSIQDCRNILLDIEKIYGKVDLAIFDYLEKFTVAGKYYNSEAGERKRRSDLADKITNICVELNCAVLTAIQANDVKATDYNKPDYVMTRNSISEFKGAINPFSYFLTVNATDEEYENQICRIYCDKLRRAKRGKTVRIYQSLNNGRFCDSHRTKEVFYGGKETV
jgi:hypothetical protein